MNQELRSLAFGIVIGVVLGLLVGAALVAYSGGDLSWLIFGGTLGVALGIGITLGLNPTMRRGKSNGSS